MTREPHASWTPGRLARGRSFQVRQADYDPSYRRGFHSHDIASITLVLQGEMGETACGRDETATSLSVVVKPAGTLHANSVGPRGARTVQVEILDETVLADARVELGEWRWLHAGPGVRPLLALREALLDPDRGPDPEEALLELLGEVVIAPGPPRSAVPPFVTRVREALDDLDAGSARVQDLARQIGVHPVSLTRAFRRAYGVPVSVYRRRVRVQRAAQRVVGTDTELGLIALDVGYADQAHMSREVRAATGLSPSRLRAAVRA